jgi:hypothetical protein
MFALLTMFVDLCRMRVKPEDLPHSHFLMLLCIGCYFLLGFATSVLEQGFGLAILAAGADTGLMVTLAYLGLQMRGFSARAVQTITALTGTGALFEFVGWPMVIFLQQLEEGQSSSLSLVLFALIIWNIMVIGHILRHALNVPMWVGTSIALIYIYITLRVINVLYAAAGIT